jgi:hypothetical protein
MNEPMQRWEYLVEKYLSGDIPAEKLKELGSESWELVDVAEGRFIFRRPSQSFVERVTMEQRARVYESLGLDPETGL